MLIPHAPDRTEIKVYCIAPKGESNKARKARLRKFEDFFMVTGMATPDDMAALEDVQRGSGQNLSNGMSSIEEEILWFLERMKR